MTSPIDDIFESLCLTGIVYSTPNANGHCLAYNPRTNTISVRSADNTQINHFFLYMVECDQTFIFIGPGDNEEMAQYLEHHIPGATIVAYDDSSVTLHFHGNTEHRWFLDGFFPMPSQIQFPNLLEEDAT